MVAKAAQKGQGAKSHQRERARLRCRRRRSREPPNFNHLATAAESRKQEVARERIDECAFRPRKSRKVITITSNVANRTRPRVRLAPSFELANAICALSKHQWNPSLAPCASQQQTCMLHELFLFFLHRLGIYGPGPLIHSENFLTHMIRSGSTRAGTIRAIN